METLTATQIDQVLLVLSMLDKCFGGLPCLEVTEKGDMRIFSDLEQDFSETYESKECDTLMEAMKDYADNRACYLQTIAYQHKGGSLH